MAKTSKKPKMGRPPLPPEKRKRPSMGFRPTAEMRGKLEEAAAASGFSLTQEVERRLERSFLDEEARDREWGGKKLHGLFRMMAGALEVIEQGRDKTCADDWGTFIAVKAAWQMLLFTSLAPRDQAFGDYLESMGRPSETFELPPLPTPPKYPALEKELRAYEKKCERWDNAASEYRKRLDAVQQHLDDMESLGKIRVLEMFSTGTRD